jgi:hypothetical protein
MARQRLVEIGGRRPLMGGSARLRLPLSEAGVLNHYISVMFRRTGGVFSNSGSLSVQYMLLGECKVFACNS